MCSLLALLGCQVDAPERAEPVAVPETRDLGRLMADDVGWADLSSFLDRCGLRATQPVFELPAEFGSIHIQRRTHDHRVVHGALIWLSNTAVPLSVVSFDGTLVVLSLDGGITVPTDSSLVPKTMSLGALAQTHPAILQPVSSDQPQGEMPCDLPQRIQWNCVGERLAIADQPIQCLSQALSTEVNDLTALGCFRGLAESGSACALADPALDTCDDGDVCNGIEICRLGADLNGRCRQTCDLSQLPNETCSLEALVRCGAPLDDSRPCHGRRPYGECSLGAQVCTTGEPTVCSRCEGVVEPEPETCNGLDDDCDGVADERLSIACFGQPCGRAGVRICEDSLWSDCLLDDEDACICAPGAVESCWEGSERLRGVGECADGKSKCLEDGSGWTECGA